MYVTTHTFEGSVITRTTIMDEKDGSSVGTVGSSNITHV